MLIKILFVWAVISLLFLAAWVISRTTVKVRAKARILWAISTGAHTKYEIVRKTGLTKPDVDDMIEELVEDRVIEDVA